jgi:hypothetical protein
VAVGGASVTVTNATFTGCLRTDGLTGNVAEVTATNFPWEITRTAVGAITIDRFNVDSTSLVCPLGHSPLAGASSGAVNNTTHTVTYSNATGLTMTFSPDASVP